MKSIKTEWLPRLLDLRAKYFKKNFPLAVKDHGVPGARPYKDTTANGLTRCIIDWINFSGGDAQRISTQGQMRKINGNFKWTFGGGRRGAADIHAIINGRAVSIEVKVGKDKQSENQKHEQERIERAGGLYFIAKDMQSFVSWYTTSKQLDI